MHIKFPLFLSGLVVPGFRRGSQLGFPTANLQILYMSDIVPEIRQAEKSYCKLNLDFSGVFYGWANRLNEEPQMMVMSIGNNPQFHNQEKSYEVHILKEYPDDFYGEILHVQIQGKLRDMKIFSNLDQLIIAIHDDIQHAKRLLLSSLTKKIKI
jgi:FAD synthase